MTVIQEEKEEKLKAEDIKKKRNQLLGKT